MEKRFTASVRVHVRDNMFGNAIVVNASWNGKTADGLLKQAEEHFAKYLGMMNTDIDEKELHSHAKHLKDSEGWGIRKIKNHFTKFDIDIEPYINSQKKLI